MAGTAAALGALAIVSTLAVGMGAVGAATVLSARASGAADASALAAADTASGAAPGTPCEVAARVAAAGGAALASCAVDGVVATVEVRVGSGLVTARGRARAGPPPGAPG
ncbi:Rv3654c family TadE-like protein [Microbacterium flavum]|uniref:Helicase n=2 Tax=Microbacterium flavum TaxID=415216 RepID=A0ABS5XYH9_9MICO|nr:Rv3654c family TadE-like protein [Microbacterium flavum]MBT8799027.1 helicase [Microbacterium flavum]